jgi:hypothetical protein
MADIISSLFGLTPIQEEIALKQRERQYGLGQLYGQATVNTNAPVAKQQAYIGKQAAQSALGGMAVRGLGSLFGVQDKELKRASDLESILNQTQQEVGGDPTQLYPLLQQRLADAGYTREAMQVGQMGAKEIQAAQLNQAKLLTEQAQLAKAQQEKLPEIVRLTNMKRLAEQQGDTALVANIQAAIDKSTNIPEKTLSPENKAQEAIYNKFVRDLGPEEGALAFDQYINQQKVKVAQGANPAIPVSISSQGNPIGQYDEKGNLTTTKGKVIPKEEMISLREAADSSKGLYDIITSITPQDIDLAFGRVTDYSQAPDAVKLGVSPEILDAQTKINKLGVREVLTNLQNLKGASSDKEMTKIASTFPGYGAAPTVMKKWAARAMGTILDFTNRKSKEFGVDAPPVSLEELAANPIFNELSEAEKSDILFKLAKYDENFKELSEKDKIQALGQMTKSKTNIDGKITDYGTSNVKRKSVGGVTYIFDGKGWRKE